MKCLKFGIILCYFVNILFAFKMNRKSKNDRYFCKTHKECAVHAGGDTDKAYCQIIDVVTEKGVDHNWGVCLNEKATLKDIKNKTSNKNGEAVYDEKGDVAWCTAKIAYSMGCLDKTCCTTFLKEFKDSDRGACSKTRKCKDIGLFPKDLVK